MGICKRRYTVTLLRIIRGRGADTHFTAANAIGWRPLVPTEPLTGTRQRSELPTNQKTIFKPSFYWHHPPAAIASYIILGAARRL